MNAPKVTAVIEYPSKAWGIVGSIPIELTELKKSHLGDEYRASKVYASKELVIEDLKKLGYGSKDGVNFYKERP